MDNKKLGVPYVEYKGEKYEFIATRMARVKLAEMQKQNTTAIAIGIKLNRINEKIKDFKKEVLIAKENSNAKPTDKDLYSIYKNCKSELAELENEGDLLLVEMVNNGEDKKQFSQAREIAFELLKEKYGIDRAKYNEIVADFEEREGKEIVDEFMVAMIDIVFTEPEVAQKTDNEFLKAYRAKKGY